MRGTRSLVMAAEAALAILTLATVTGMGRLFVGGSWLGPLVANAVAAHLAATVLRRRGASLPVTAVAMALGALVVSTWVSYASTTTAGIPTGDTWAAMRNDLDVAWTLYQDVVAPTPAEPGFVLASGLAVWCIAYVADWAAFRLWVPFEATLPAGTLFLFTALLGSDRGRGWAVALFATSVLGFLLVHRLARQDASSHWVAERRALGHRSLLTVGASLGLVAVVTGTVLGPAFPGADSPGVFDPTSLHDSDNSRVTISPLVDIRSRLVDQADTEVFRVRSPVRSYWRLTSLERFDGRIWSSSGSYGSADGALPTAVESTAETAHFNQTFHIAALTAIWLPSAYEPRALDIDGAEIRYDEESATLIVDNDIATSDQLEYQVTSASPRLTVEDLAGSAGDVPADILERFSGLPDDFSPDVRKLADDVTSDAASPYEQARALQDYLRTFTYDLEIGPGHGGDALEQFLFETQRGYCEQFAGSFAAMARSIGLPARVAVGFTPGDVDPADPDVFRVRGEHAHAWPEVFFAGAGWVAFEPTPGRGMPFGEVYTGVPESQAATNDPASATTIAPPADGATIPTLPNGDQGPRDPDANLDTFGPDPASPDEETEPALDRFVLSPLATVAPIALAILLAYAILFPLGLLVRRFLRRRRATTAADRIQLAWTETVEHGALVGFEERASETYDERSRRLGAALPTAAPDATQMARLLETAAYSAEGAGDDEADEAGEAAHRIGGAARAAAPRVARARRWLDPRPLVEAWRGDRRAQHRRITTTARGDLEVERELVGSDDRG